MAPLPQHSLFVYPGPVAASADGSRAYIWARLSSSHGEVFPVQEGVWPDSFSPGFVARAAVVDPQDPLRTFVAEPDGCVHLSTDGAETWTERSTGLPGGETVDLLMDSDDADHLLLVHASAGTWESVDAGLSWSRSLAGIGAEVVAAAWGPATGEIFLATSEGVYASAQGYLNDGLENRHPTALTFLVPERTLLLGTRYRGVFARKITAPAVDAPEGSPSARSWALRVAPTPFAHRTRIEFFSPGVEPGVDVGVYSVDGRRVRDLISGSAGAGWNHVVWDGRTNAGRRAAAGMYFVRLRGEGVDETEKVTVLGGRP